MWSAVLLWVTPACYIFLRVGQKLLHLQPRRSLFASKRRNEQGHLLVSIDTCTVLKLERIHTANYVSI